MPDQIKNESIRIVPHARTLRNARVQVEAMVAAGFSIHEIRIYLQQWACWWQKTVSVWHVEDILHRFINMCWEIKPAAVAAGLLKKIKLSHTSSSTDCQAAA